MTESLKGVVAFTVTDKGALYASYMRFVQNGGVFVPTARHYDLGDKVFLLLQVMDNPSPIPLRGEVAWITPAGAQGNRTAGIGIRFDDESDAGSKAIEEILANLTSAERPTHTM